MRLTIDSGQHKDKSDYYHSFKIRLKVDLRVRLGSHVRRVNLVDLIKYKIKTVIIIVLKLDSRVKLRQNPSYKSGGSTWVNVSIKVIITVLKLNLMVDRGKA